MLTNVLEPEVVHACEKTFVFELVDFNGIGRRAVARQTSDTTWPDNPYLVLNVDGTIETSAGLTYPEIVELIKNLLYRHPRWFLASVIWESDLNKSTLALAY